MMPRQSYSRFFWGLLLVILDLRLNRLDVLPDFVGHIIISLAASRIASLSPAFQRVVLPAATLAVLDIVGHFTTGDLATILGYLDAIIDCFMIWLLLGAVATDCGAHGHDDLVASAHSRRRWYVGMIIAMHIFGLIASGSRDLATALAVIGVVGFLILLVLVLSLLRSARLRLFGH
jgi:hypothetical protein